jgi:hypothetical protein
MVHILAKRHVSRLSEFASSNVILAFDYDGTLAPLAPDPEFAPMRSKTGRLLRAVAQRYPSVVIPGRARADLALCWIAPRDCPGVGLDAVGARAGSFPRASLESRWTKPLRYAARGPEDAPV